MAFEDQCQRHPETDLPGVVADRYNAGQTEHLRSLLDESPDAGSAIVGAYTHAWGLNEAITTHRDRVYLRQRGRAGETSRETIRPQAQRSS